MLKVIFDETCFFKSDWHCHRHNIMRCQACSARAWDYRDKQEEKRKEVTE